MLNRTNRHLLLTQVKVLYTERLAFLGLPLTDTLSFVEVTLKKNWLTHKITRGSKESNKESKHGPHSATS